MSVEWALTAEEEERCIRQNMAYLSMDKNKPKASSTPPPPAPVAETPPQTDDSEENDAISAAERSYMQKVIRKGLVEIRNDLEVQRRDPNSPLFHVKTFEELDLKPELLQGLYDMGFNAPSKIQETTLPAMLADPPMNLIAQSQSGTGKTAAFILAMLSRLDTSKKYTQVVCLSPTFELAIQTGEVAVRMAKFMSDVEVAFALRGEERSASQKVEDHIVFGTPGKMVDWGVKLKLFDLSKVRMFVLDEADIMISTQGHYEQVHRVRKHLSRDCQMLLFSATYDQKVMEFAGSIIANPIILRLRKEEESLDNIKQYYVKCKTEQDKYTAISNIYGVITIGQAIIFCQTKRSANWLCEKMTKDGHSVAMLSSDLVVEQRLNVLDRFREGRHKVLITTNVLSRGIDIEQVSIVINFHLPLDGRGQPDCETYLHRIGRTGRFGKHGLAINLVQDERELNVLQVIQNHFGKEIACLNVHDFNAIESLQD